VRAAKYLSTRDQIRDGAECALREAGRPLHYREIAAAVLPTLSLSNTVSAKALNTSLHDDTSARFKRVGKGTWALAH